MTLVYIKFRHKDDIYAVSPDYDLRPSGDNFVPPKVCGRCGDTLYIPVELPEGMAIEKSFGDIHVLLPKERPDLVARSAPDSATLFVPLDKPTRSEIERLKQFPSMVWVGNSGFEMLIDNFSGKPVEHKCPVPPYPERLAIWTGESWKGLDDH